MKNYGPSVMYTSPAGSPGPGVLYARAMQTGNGSNLCQWAVSTSFNQQWSVVTP